MTWWNWRELIALVWILKCECRGMLWTACIQGCTGWHAMFAFTRQAKGILSGRGAERCSEESGGGKMLLLSSFHSFTKYTSIRYSQSRGCSVDWHAMVQALHIYAQGSRLPTTKWANVHVIFQCTGACVHIQDLFSVTSPSTSLSVCLSVCLSFI